jgi:hypothetical protein
MRLIKFVSQQRLTIVGINILLRKGETLFCIKKKEKKIEKHSDPSKLFSETNIIKILDFLIGNLFIILSGFFFSKQSVFLLVPLCSCFCDFYSYEADFMQGLATNN